eukprot:1384994-Rhodomonas_salina.1
MQARSCVDPFGEYLPPGQAVAESEPHVQKWFPGHSVHAPLSKKLPAGHPHAPVDAIESARACPAGQGSCAAASVVHKPFTICIGKKHWHCCELEAAVPEVVLFAGHTCCTPPLWQYVPFSQALHELEPCSSRL